ncbi:YkgJ family cysteine cluster protein [Methanospirillum stamsii]|nr:YkgJ family cysteine cluster protein [Methanospirillum stamsii]
MNTSTISLAQKILENRFSCQCCGACCTEYEPGSNRVMVSPEEIHRIMEGSGLSFEEIAEPYPERIQESGRDYTFGWVIRQKGNHCMFLSESRCTIYQNRPWICRTYPFMLDNDDLIVHPCSGLNRADSIEDPKDIALNLLKRQEFEHADEDRIRNIFATKTIPAGKPVVIDGEGIKEYHG